MSAGGRLVHPLRVVLLEDGHLGRESHVRRERPLDAVVAIHQRNLFDRVDASCACHKKECVVLCVCVCVCVA